MLTINNLSVAYGSKTVISDLNISMDNGKVYGIMGYNGAGKTTLLNAIFGIPNPSKCILYNGFVLNRSNIAYLDTEIFFYSNITGRDYLSIFKEKNSLFDFETLSAIFNIPLDQVVDSYSTGMKKKLAIVGILSMNKQIIMLDEPYNGLDLESVSALQIIIKKLAKQGKLIILTSHIMGSLSSVCDSVLLLQNGNISKEYLPDEFDSLSEEIIREFDERFCVSINKVFEK